MIDPREEVTEMFSKLSARRLFAAGLVAGVLAAVAPTAAVASNGGGGPGQPPAAVSK